MKQKITKTQQEHGIYFFCLSIRETPAEKKGDVILAVGSDEIKLLFNIIADYVGARTHKRFITWCSVSGIKRFILP